MSNRVKTLLESDPSIGTSFGGIECKSTLCRVVVSYKTDEARQSFHRHVGSMIPPRSHAFVHPDEKGGSVIYFAREGHKLPLK